MLNLKTLYSQHKVNYSECQPSRGVCCVLTFSEVSGQSKWMLALLVVLLSFQWIEFFFLDATSHKYSQLSPFTLHCLSYHGDKSKKTPNSVLHSQKSMASSVLH